MRVYYRGCMLDAAFARIVAAAWHAALGVPPASLDEDFFAAGGHSLVATELAVRLSQALGIDVPLTMVFDCPTVRGQTAWLAEHVQPTRAGERRA
jgi:acyl carrier protein